MRHVLAVGGLVEQAAQVVAQEDGDDGRRGLKAAQTVVVADGGRGEAQQVGIFVHTLDKGAEHQLELQVLLRLLSRGEQVDAVIGHQ